MARTKVTENLEASQNTEAVIEDFSLPIHRLIPLIMADVGNIPKSSYNSGQKFHFRGIDSVMEAFQPALIKYGVFYTPEVIEATRSERDSKSGGTLIYTRLRIKYTFYAPDGTTISAIVEGEGMDSGDKSTNKAMSAALKYALLQVFCVPADEADDADSENPQLAPRQRQTSQPVQQNEIIKMIQPAQIAALENLMKVKGIGIATIIQKFAYAGCKSINELTFSNAADAIRYLSNLSSTGTEQGDPYK